MTSEPKAPEAGKGADRASPEARRNSAPEPAAGHPPAEASSADEIARFIVRARTMAPPAAPSAVAAGAARGRLIFAMDATMSRQPTWDMALALQAEMFHAVKLVGGLDVKLAWFRGMDECRASGWASDADALARLMAAVSCRGGFTQIAKILALARREAEAAGKEGRKVAALVYVGDCMEEDVDRLSALAGELGLLGAPAFMFQEGRDAAAETAFREIARLTGGAYCRFSQGSAGELRELLTAAAVYAAGGRAALADHSRAGGAGRLLLAQLGAK